VLQQWVDDSRTVSGKIFHENADDPFKREKRGNVIISRSIPISSSILGLSGRCDVVEFIIDETGVFVPQIGSKCIVLPVEYKVGKKKKGPWDEVQLCAEAMSLEELFKTEIKRGCLYYGLERRRTDVLFTEELRNYTMELANEMHDAFDNRIVFKPEHTQECKKCSLLNICMPDSSKDVNEYISNYEA